MSVGSDSSDESLKAITITLGTVTASVARMHRVLIIILTLAFIQGHTYLNRKNNKGSIISETVPAMPNKLALVHVIFSQSNDLDLHPQSQLRLKLHKCFTCTILVIYRTIFKLWHANLADLCMLYMLMLVSMTLTLQGHSDLAEDKFQPWIISATKQAISRLD